MSLLFSRMRAAALAVVAAAATLVSGCFDLETEVRFNADASGDTVVRFGFDREMEDVFALLRTLAKVSNEPSVAALAGGICSPSALEKAPADLRQRTRIRKFEVNGRLYCEIAHRADVMDPAKATPDPTGILKVESTGPRRWKMTLDFERVPDVTPFLLLGVLQQLQQHPQYAGRVGTPEIMEVVAASKKAYVAATAMAMRNRHVEITVRAPKVLNTMGAVRADATSATFRISWAELMRLTTDATARVGKRFAVELEY